MISSPFDSFRFQLFYSFFVFIHLSQDSCLNVYYLISTAVYEVSSDRYTDYSDWNFFMCVYVMKMGAGYMCVWGGVEGKGPTPGQNVETKENRLSIAWNILETMQSSQCPYNQTGLKRVECLWAIAGWLTGRI